ncbi:MAG TPA: hypothetical protein VFU05_00250, partial [Cyclobacteriaceae bacterium]|nr:hypothetical protein [Cyclobacteriaceae bacterium]
MSRNRAIANSALVALTGYITSGPLGFLLVYYVKPQPSWISPEVFAANYHIVQDLPYYFGFLLIGGMVMLVTGHCLDFNNENSGKRFRLLAAFGFTIAFFVIISFNYICQTTFVRQLALNYEPEYDSTIASFSMANPMSLCWAIEIWGYGFLGVATWFLSGYYSGKNRTIQILLWINGMVSIATIVLMIIDMDWLMTPIGLSAYFVWNVLMIVLMILIYNYSRKLTS